MIVPPLRLWAPKHWLAWCLILLLWVMAKLPYRWMLAFGRGLGLLGYCLVKSRVRIAEKNIALCFPDKSPDAQKALVKESFASLGMGFMECGLAWFGSPKKIETLSSVQNADIYQRLTEANRPIIVLWCHMTTTEMGARIGATVGPVSAVNRPLDSAVFEWISRQKRTYFQHVVSRFKMKKIIEALLPNHMLAILPDHDLGVRNSVFAPFFGVQAATITSVAKLARKYNAWVMPIFSYRKKDAKGYELVFHEPLVNFPGDDEVENAKRINAAIEAGIRVAPEQYFWVHRRFKHRPEGMPRLY